MAFPLPDPPVPSPEDLRAEFALDEGVVFLNPGSFGACPRPVLAAQAAWIGEMERQPVLFIARRYPDLMAAARERIAAELGSAPLDLVWVVNSTVGVNVVARSLARRLGPGDEVLGCDHEYGACDRTWSYLAARGGFDYRQAAVPVPVASPEALLETLWAAVTPRTRVLFLSHITSPTALVLPVAEICRRAREAGILTLIDGAHAPAHVDLDLAALGADFYTGNFHKWACAPKGSAFLYARPEAQALLDPLVISWGWEPEIPGPSPFIDQIEFWGTRDVTPFLSVPAALDFQAERHWPAVRERCRRLVRAAREALLALPGVEALQAPHPELLGQMVAVALPAGTDVLDLKTRLYDRHRVELPLYLWQERPLLRVSIQGYNGEDDLAALLAALRAEL